MRLHLAHDQLTIVVHLTDVDRAEIHEKPHILAACGIRLAQALVELFQLLVLPVNHLTTTQISPRLPEDINKRHNKDEDNEPQGHAQRGHRPSLGFHLLLIDGNNAGQTLRDLKHAKTVVIKLGILHGVI